MTNIDISRRSFMKGTLGGLVLAFTLGEAAGALDLLGGIPEVDAAGAATINAWLTIGADESITFTIGASEMGQGSFSGLAQVLAEELCVSYSRIATVQGSPSVAAVQPIGASISTVGSSVMRTNFWKMRDAGATAREMLVSAAMNAQGDQTRTNYAVTDGVITHTPSGATYTYGAMAPAAALLTPPASAPLVPDDQLRVIGTTVPRVDIPAKVNGSAKFGIDVQLPNMVYAIIKHCPAFGGTLKVTPATPAGMLKVVPVKVWAGTNRGLEAVGNVNAVAVVGTDTWSTMQAANKLVVSWNLPVKAPVLNDAQFIADGTALLSTATPYVAGGTNGPGTLYTAEGVAADAAAAVSGAAKQHRATYTLPYVAHATMEVLNCTVDYVAGVKCTIYAPTQGAKNVLNLAASITGLPTSAIQVVTTYLGGGLGRKWELDFISQAIQVGMALGRPVKLMWPREEDFTHDQYRPMGVIGVSAGLDSNNAIAGWSFRAVSPSLSQQRGTVLPATGDTQGTEAATKLPYAIGARSTEYVSHPSPIPVGYWRSVGASLNTFAVECSIDELAALAGEDPYLFRRSRLTDPRWIAVLDAAAAAGNWSSPVAAGHARGIAIGSAFNSIVAEVVDASLVTSTSATGVVTTTVKVNSVAVAIDSYLVVNPGQVEHQIIGGVVHGLNAALYGRAIISGGAVQNNNFRNNRMIRMGEMPTVKVVAIPNPTSLSRTATIGGVGELGVPALAPALANAYFRLTGTRVRTLPFYPNAIMSGL